MYQLPIQSNACTYKYQYTPALLPPAYVVRREGTVFTGVCLSTPGGGGTPAKVGTLLDKVGTSCPAKVATPRPR